MMSLRYEGLFEDWEIGVAKNIIERFRGQWKCLKLEDFDDPLQECLAHWYFRKERYDPSAGANQRTFMARVLENKLGHIIGKLSSNKRKVSIHCASLDELITEEEDAPTFLDRLSEDEGHASNLHISAELKIDISRVIQRLTPKQQELCRLLGEEGLNIKQASEVLKIPRGTLYEDIKRIKAIFQKEKLHEYLD